MQFILLPPVNSFSFYSTESAQIRYSIVKILCYLEHYVLPTLEVDYDDSFLLKGNARACSPSDGLFQAFVLPQTYFPSAQCFAHNKPFLRIKQQDERNTLQYDGKRIPPRNGACTQQDALSSPPTPGQGGQGPPAGGLALRRKTEKCPFGGELVLTPTGFFGLSYCPGISLRRPKAAAAHCLMLRQLCSANAGPGGSSPWRGGPYPAAASGGCRREKAKGGPQGRLSPEDRRSLRRGCTQRTHLRV